MKVVAADIGGTHARFALAEVGEGRVIGLGAQVTFKTADYSSLESAWEGFERHIGGPLPRAAAIALAGPIKGDVLKLTNNPWVIRPAALAEALGLDRLRLINDFGAVSHAVADVEGKFFSHLCGPDKPLPHDGVISVIGPGTGFGVAQVLRRDGRTYVIETEGGHIDFAPLDAIEDALLLRLRSRHRRVSIERIVSGPGLVDIYETLAAIEGRAITQHSVPALWTAALERRDSLVVAALDRFCLSLGSIAGDIALTHGASGVVIAGGLGLKLAESLPLSGFAERFTAKGRFERLMASIPVKLITHPEPGLYGAAASLAQEAASQQQLAIP